MKISDTIKSSIARLPQGYVFTCSTFTLESANREAVIKTLNRMVLAGKIVKVSKGRFYKPEETPFGKLQPSQAQIIKDLLEKDGKIIGYLTGYSIYNQLGLTSQISSVIEVGKNDVRSTFKRDRYTISFVKQKNVITKENVPFLQLLDAMRYIKRIPDTTIAGACNRIVAIIKKLSRKDRSVLVRLALKYPPATRALLGVLLESAGDAVLTESLRKSLNPITVYKLPGVKEAFSHAERWYIK